jgi:hypothetical protein
MKKKFLAVVLFICAYSSTLFAGNELEVTKQVRQKFEKTYPGALYARWETVEKETIFSVRFVYHNRSMVVYYDPTGAEVGCASIIAIDNLPATLRKKIGLLYKGSEIVSVQQLQIDNGTTYYVEIQKNGESIFIEMPGR